ncbi:hypothetical protein [Aeromonas bestiarum]|uniref:hypothetical protein n=1 Tax=Aeromonas bestiarum TaxID=105751 RepID=UPI0032B2891C
MSHGTLSIRPINLPAMPAPVKNKVIQIVNVVTTKEYGTPVEVLNIGLLASGESLTKTAIKCFLANFPLHL